MAGGGPGTSAALAALAALGPALDLLDALALTTSVTPALDEFDRSANEPGRSGVEGLTELGPESGVMGGSR